MGLGPGNDIALDPHRRGAKPGHRVGEGRGPCQVVGVLSRTDPEEFGDLGEADQRRDSPARHVVYNIN